MVGADPIAPGDRQANRRQVEMTTHHRIPTTAAVVLSLAAASVPTATARPVDDPATPVHQAPAAVYSRPDKSLIPVATADGGQAAGTANAPQAVVRIQTPQSGFDWGDAGIGAAGGIALSMIGLGGALLVSQNRARRTRRTTALPG
jgi:hypothetical protein